MSSLDEKKTICEIEKLRLEIAQLSSESRRFVFWGRNAWPVLAGVLSLIVSTASFWIANQTSRRQMSVETDLKNQEDYRSTLSFATDNKEGPNARIAGIWALSRFWHIAGYERALAQSLASVLAMDGKEEHATRAAAAEVIGTAIQIDDIRGRTNMKRIKLIAEALYGSTEDGKYSLGAVSTQNVNLRNDCPYKDGCSDQLEQTRQAIRKNWKFLEFANLQLTDLTKIPLYVADLRGAAFAGAVVTSADFRCANLEDTKFDQFQSLKNSTGDDGGTAALPNVQYANVRGATPKSFHDWAVNFGGAVDLPDDVWHKTRPKGTICDVWQQVEINR